MPGLLNEEGPKTSANKKEWGRIILKMTVLSSTGRVSRLFLLRLRIQAKNVREQTVSTGNARR